MAELTGWLKETSLRFLLIPVCLARIISLPSPFHKPVQWWPFDFPVWLDWIYWLYWLDYWLDWLDWRRLDWLDWLDWLVGCPVNCFTAHLLTLSITRLKKSVICNSKKVRELTMDSTFFQIRCFRFRLWKFRLLELQYALCSFFITFGQFLISTHLFQHRLDFLPLTKELRYSVIHRDCLNMSLSPWNRLALGI